VYHHVFVIVKNKKAALGFIVSSSFGKEKLLVKVTAAMLKS